jgi:hypothetical protein
MGIAAEWTVACTSEMHARNSPTSCAVWVRLFSGEA